MNTTPKAGTLTKLYYSEKPTPEEQDLTHVMYTEEIPELEEAPEPVTYQTVDMEEEYSEQGSKKSTQPAISVFYLASQHKTLKKLADSKKTLVKRFMGSCALTGQAITSGDIIKDTLTLYRNTPIEEFDGMPTGE